MLEHFSWIHGLWLFGAIALEILANVLLKMSNGFKRVSLGAAAIACVLGAFTCLSFAVKGIPLSVAYALWGSFGIIITAISSRGLSTRPPSQPVSTPGRSASVIM